MFTLRLAIAIGTLVSLVVAVTAHAESNGPIGWGDLAKLETADWGWNGIQVQQPAERDSGPSEVILASMKAEVRGQLGKREQLLGKREQLLDATDDTELSHSLLGRMREKSGDWIDIEQSIQTASEDRKLDLYRQTRNGLQDTLDSHWWIARWCVGNRLPEQARAHLERVLFFNADHTPARRALGYVAMNGDWVSPDEVEQFQSRAEYSRRSMRNYGKQIHQIATRMQSSSVRVVEHAIDKLASIDDPLAGPAIESVLANRSPEGAEQSLQWFGRVNTIETSRTLCRFALYHPSPDIRQQATNFLAERPLHEFVPELLGMIVSKLDASIIPVFDRNGLFIGVRKTFAQEDMDTQRVTVVNELMVGRSGTRNRVNTRQRQPPMSAAAVLETAFTAADNRDVQQIALARAQIEAEATTQNVAQQNRLQQRRNEKISELLSQIAGIHFAGSSDAMWRWWDEFNEVELQESKYVRTSLVRLDTSEVTYRNLTEFFTPPIRTSECFIAGTLVVTQRGNRPIESIVPGDLVLNRNLQTGSLQWKPVFQATTRSPAETLLISIGEERLQCTRGHLFWVSGQGWKKASELKKGDFLHAAAEPQQVTEIQEGEKRQTHNLKVADNANYFVGSHKILTHDVTMRKPNRQPIPGYNLAVSLEKQRSRP